MGVSNKWGGGVPLRENYRGMGRHFLHNGGGVEAGGRRGEFLHCAYVEEFSNM